MLFGICFNSSTEHSNFVNLFEVPKNVHINSTLNINACNNKAYLPLELPKGAKGFIYSVKSVGKSKKDEPKSNLINNVKKLSAKYDASQVSDFIEMEGNQKEFNLYIIEEKSNIMAFYNCGGYHYLNKYINTKSRSGFVELKDNEPTSIYFGIENPRNLSSVNLEIEVVAIL